MIKVDEALKIVFDNVKELPSDTIPIELSLGRILSADISADFDIPACDISSMDGYAVNSEDKSKIFNVVGESKAGEKFVRSISSGEAVNIMTGGIIPDGADSVVMVEHTKLISVAQVEILKASIKGENIRCQGEEVKQNTVVLRKGKKITPEILGMLARVGRTEVAVSYQPQVAIVSTGNEIINIDEILSEGTIFDANYYILSGMVDMCGGQVVRLGIVRDEVEEIKTVISRGLSSDVILLSGGVSAGKYDLVHIALEELSGTILFHKVAQRPGKPVLFGKINDVLIFGLPGNPVSVAVTFENFVKPVLYKMQGAEYSPLIVEAVLEKDFVKDKGLKYFVRAKTEWRDGVFYSMPYDNQSSGVLRSCVESNSLIILDEEQEFIKAGTKIKIKYV
ncbi:MAG: molybdopterin molybdotransferase MoeA [Candidatus Omnitrophica bacterium]|nr:molybdopterin molybdotransferase MoeA [Candidatus Omnitrophota bacterium]